MPSASDYLREKWHDDENGEWKAMAFLYENGWKQIGNGFMQPPTGRGIEQMSQDEYEALSYLIHEWDFGYLPPDMTLEEYKTGKKFDAPNHT